MSSCLSLLAALGVVGLTAGGVTAARAGLPAQAVTRVTVNLADPLSISLGQGLVFGVLLPTWAGLYGDDAQANLDWRDVTSLAPQSAASVRVAGGTGQSVTVNTPMTVELSRVGGDEHLTIATQTLMDGAAGGGDGATVWKLAGRIKVTRAALAGEYRGLLVITAEYN